MTAALALPETNQEEVDVKVSAINQAIEGLIENSELKNKEDLESEINTANQNIGTAIVSVDGSDISTSDFWVTQEEKSKYKSAIALAQEVNNNISSTESEIHNATVDLISATNIFSENKKLGLQGLDQLTFKVGPSDNSVQFYATLGYDNEGFDLYNESEPLVSFDEGITSQFRVYQVFFPEDLDSISFRG